MNMNSTISADNKQQLQVEETDDSCRLQFFEIVPLSRDTDGSCTTQCVSGDWSVEVKQENLAVLEQEPDVVCCVIYFTIYCSNKSSYHYFVTVVATLLICIT